MVCFSDVQYHLSTHEFNAMKSNCTLHMQAQWFQKTLKEKSYFQTTWATDILKLFIHSFWLFHALRLFKALRLSFLTSFPEPTFIPCPTSIMDSRVKKSQPLKINEYISTKIMTLVPFIIFIRPICNIQLIDTIEYLNFSFRI